MRRESFKQNFNNNSVCYNNWNFDDNSKFWNFSQNYVVTKKRIYEKTLERQWISIISSTTIKIICKISNTSRDVPLEIPLDNQSIRNDSPLFFTRRDNNRKRKMSGGLFSFPFFLNSQLSGRSACRIECK